MGLKNYLMEQHGDTNHIIANEQTKITGHENVKLRKEKEKTKDKLKNFEFIKSCKNFDLYKHKTARLFRMLS